MSFGANLLSISYQVVFFTVTKYYKLCGNADNAP